MTDHITASPLTWPAGWPRHSGQRERARFGTKVNAYGGLRAKTIEEATAFVMQQLTGRQTMNLPPRDVIISTDLKLRLDGLPYSNQRVPDDPGAAVYWRDSRGQDKVIALDKYDRIADNIYAIGKTLEALRGIERWGGGQILDRAFSGFVALPSPEMAGGVDPYELLGIDPDDSLVARRAAYRRALAKHHPDHGGDPAKFNQVRRAAEQIGLR